MDKKLKLLVMEEKKTPKDRRLGSRLDRSKALNAILSSGAKVRHDSGGRLIVIEVPKAAEKALAKSLPTAGALSINEPGANVLTTEGGAGTNRIFLVNNATAIISSVTLTGGNGTGAVILAVRLPN